MGIAGNVGCNFLWQIFQNLLQNEQPDVKLEWGALEYLLISLDATGCTQHTGVEMQLKQDIDTEKLTAIIRVIFQSEQHVSELVAGLWKKGLLLI